MAIRKDTLDQLLDGRDPKEVFNKDGSPPSIWPLPVRA